MINFNKAMERNSRRKSNQRKRRNKEAGHQSVSSTQDDEVTQLRRENAQLTEELNDAQHLVHVIYFRWVYAEQRAAALSDHLGKTDADLFHARKKVERLEREAQQRRNQQRSADAFVPVEELDELVTVVTDAHDWITYGWEPPDNEEEAECEFQESMGKLKSGIINLNEKLQQDQRALIKKAYKHDSCTTEKGGHCKKNPKEQTEVEKINLHIQTLQMDLLKQALSVRYPAKKPPHKIYHDQWQQTDEPQANEDHNETCASSMAQLDQGDHSETCASSMAQLDQEDHSETCASSMAQLDQEDHSETCASSMAQLDQEDVSETCSSSMARLDPEDLNEACSSSMADLDPEDLNEPCSSSMAQFDLLQANTEVPAAEQRLEERLQEQQSRWQQERQYSNDALHLPQETKEKKRKEWEEKEREMANRVDELESRMQGMLEKKARKKRSWFKRLFSCFSS